MKIKQIGNQSFACPMYLVRAGAGWQVRVPQQESRFFSDSICGGIQEAFQMALAYRRQLLPITNQVRVLKSQEIPAKKHPTGSPGIFLATKRRKDRPSLEYAFVVTYPSATKPRSTVYIGSEKTWQRNYDAKLAKAIELRQCATNTLLMDNQALGMATAKDCTAFMADVERLPIQERSF